MGKLVGPRVDETLRKQNKLSSIHAVFLLVSEHTAGLIFISFSLFNTLRHCNSLTGVCKAKLNHLFFFFKKAHLCRILWCFDIRD